MEDYYEYLDSNGVTTLYKLIKDDTVALIDSYSVTINGITTTLDTHINDSDIHTPISDIESMVDTKISGLVNSAPETLDTLKELSDALGNDPNFATTVANQIGNKASKDDVYTKEETDTLLEGKANSEHNHVVSDITDFPTIPTKLSQLENDMGFGSGSGGVITSISWTNITDKPNFATVATSGSYNDLSNKPTIPNVYNKTLTIQKNGTNVATFTSNSNTDVTADITVPTKVSELSNDSGFITGVSWDKVTNKPTLSKVATSGSYTDLSNTPAIPTKVSQLENDMGFGTGGDTSDCVHKTGDETIDGNKFFIQDVNVKNNDVDIAVTPSNNLFSCFRFRGKGNVTTASIQYSQRTYGVNDICFYVFDASSNTHGFRIRTDNRLEPIENDTYSLGSSSSKWADVYSTNAHINNTYTNRVTTYSITHPSGDNNSYFFMSGGSDYDKGATLYLGGVSATNFTPGRFALAARKTDGSSVELAGSPNGTLTWGGKNIALDENLVHRSGNEAISGAKIFLNDIFRKNTSADLTVTPTGYTNTNIIFADKNDKTLAHIEYVQRPSGVNDVGIFAWDKNGNAHGIHINTNNEVIPLMSSSESYSLGSATYKWGKVYSNDVVHTSGDEHISGNKIFSNTIHRYADLTTSGGVQVYRFVDTNANSCGHIFNNAHWAVDTIINSLGAYNEKSGKTTEIHIVSNDAGGGMAYVEGSARKGNLETVTSATGHTAIATMGWVNNPATSTNVVHRSGDEAISGVKHFYNAIYGYQGVNFLNDAMDINTTPTSTIHSNIYFKDKNYKTISYIQYAHNPNGIHALGCFLQDSANKLYGVVVNSAKEFYPFGDNTYSLGKSNMRWKNVYATTFNGKSVLCTDGNAFMAQNGGYTFLIRNDGSNTYLLMSDKDGTPGTWSTARPLIISNDTGVCSINGNANSAYYSDTPATSDNSTRIATTAWVRNYVNSVVGSGSVGASISAYYSNATTLTAEGHSSSSSGPYPSDYSDYIDISPKVGTIYTGSQLFSSFTPTASGTIFRPPTGSGGTASYLTTAKATANFSGAFSSSAKYLCTTANAVRFRAYVSQGTNSSMGSPSVVDNTSTKSIFIRVQ